MKTIFFLLLISSVTFAWNTPPTSTQDQYLKYKNFLINPGMENAVNSSNWSASGGSLTIATSAGQVKEGGRALSWDPSAASTLASSGWATKQDTAVNALGQCWIKTADSDYDLQIYDGSSVVAEVDVAASSDLFVPVSVSFVASESTTYRIRLEAQGDEDVAYIDDCYLGENFLLGQVSQASFVGSARWVPAINCTWDVSSTSASSYGADSDCTTPVGASLQGSATAPATKIPAISFSQLPPGRYYIYATGVFLKNGVTSSTRACWRFSDGTNVTDSSCVQPSGTTARAGMGSVHGDITYTSGQNSVTIQLQAFSDGAAESAQIVNDSNVTSVSGLNISLYRYPTSAELVLTPSLTGWFVDASITGANPSLGTSAQSAYVGITNGSLTMTKNTGSADVQIGCSTTNAPTGLTCSSGDESVSVSFLPPSAGMYIACASFGHRINTGASGLVNATFQVVETATNAQTVLQEGNSKTASHSFSNFDLAHPVRICGNFNFNDNSRKMIRLMYEQSVNATISNNELLADAAANNGQRNIRWEVYPVSQGVQAQVMNQVSTDTVAGDRECWVQFGGASEVSACTSNPCTIYRGSGCVSSVTWNSTGNYTLNFATGKFSAAPVCIAQAIAAGTQRLVLPQSRSTTSYNVIFRTLADANVDISGQVSCIGPK